MKKRDKFDSFEEYEDYLNKVSHFWTMMYKLFPEIKNFEHPCVFDFTMITLVNDLEYLEQHIKMLELLCKNNTEENRKKYADIVNKISDIATDFM